MSDTIRELEEKIRIAKLRIKLAELERELIHGQPLRAVFKPLQPNGTIRLLVRLPQSGKTQIMLDSIADFMSRHPKPLIIVVCDNSLLLITQTVSRGKTHQHINVGKITSNANGYCEWNDIDAVDKPDKTTGIRKANIDYRVLNGEVNTIVLCSNKRRWNDIEELVNKYKDSFNIHLWIDEADKTVGGIDGMDSGAIRRIDQLNEWKTQIPLINLITATPFSPKRRWNRFKWIGQNFGGTVELVKIDEVVGAGYHHLRDSQFVKQDDIVDNPAAYAREYLSNDPPNAGDLFLIPGSTIQESHFEVRDMCLKEGFFDYVIVLNGKTKSIESEAMIFDKSNPNFKQSLKIKEVADWLGEWYTEYNGKYKRIAITGNLCISRGITISSNTCQITHMIFSGGGNLRENDQLMSRVCGYCYSAENKPTVVCSQGVWDEVSKYQEVIIEVAKLAMSSNHEDRILDEDKMNTIINNIDRNKRVPFMFDGFSENDVIFTGSRKERKKALFDRVRTSNPELFMFTRESKCKQITRPRTPESYKKHVEDTYSKYLENKNFIIDFSPQDKMDDCWMAVIDSINHRVFVIVWVVNSTCI
jgi:hypothetical protein